MIERPDGSWQPEGWPEVVDEASGEPVGGWVTGRQLFNTELAMVVLCKFTGERANECVGRGVSHPDEDCAMMYWSADAIASGFIPDQMVAPEIRTAPGADPTFVEPS